MTKSAKDKVLMCSICNKVIEPDLAGWKGGHNAEPVNDGRCCESCNIHVVIPTRLAQMGPLR